jgi:hypothetical protein
MRINVFGNPYIRRCALHAKPPTSPSAAALSHQRSPVRVLSLRSLVPFMGRILMCSGCHWALISLHLLRTPRAQQFVSSDASEEEQTFLENQRRTGQASQAGADGDGRLVQCSAKASVGRLEAAAELRRDLALGCSRASSGRRRPRARSDSGALRRVGRAQPAPMASLALVRTSGRAPRPPCASLTARLCSRLRITLCAGCVEEGWRRTHGQDVGHLTRRTCWARPHGHCGPVGPSSALAPPL